MICHTIFARGEIKMKQFIPKEYKNEVITIRLSTEKVLIIDRLAADNNLSRNKFIGQCIDFALQNMFTSK